MSASFRAMSTEVTVVAPGLDPAAEAALAGRVRADFAESERRFSRFRADSELGGLHRAAGPVAVSAPLFAALRRARRYFEETAGIFDPAVGGPLAALGYDRSFAPGALDREAPGPAAAPASFADVALDPVARTVTLPPGTRLDLGGMIKGHTADRAARRLPDVGAVDAGGDAVLRGAGPDGAGWLVDVEAPGDPDRVLVTLRVRDRAVATSAADRRRWTAGDRVMHHLVDPRTRLPAETDLAQVTVLASSAEHAEVLAKCAFILGREAGRRLLERSPEVAAVLVRGDGTLELVGQVEVADA